MSQGKNYNGEESSDLSDAISVESDDGDEKEDTNEVSEQGEDEGMISDEEEDETDEYAENDMEEISEGYPEAEVPEDSDVESGTYDERPSITRPPPSKPSSRLSSSARNTTDSKSKSSNKAGGIPRSLAKTGNSSRKRRAVIRENSESTDLPSRGEEIEDDLTPGIDRSDDLGNDEEDEEDEDEEFITRPLAPDVSRMTERQRSRLVAGQSGVSTPLELLEESKGKKKELTAEEIALRRTETARKRKNLSTKRLEEEKMDTINRLLRRQPTKGNKGSGSENNAPSRRGGGTPGPSGNGRSNESDAGFHKEPPTCLRWINSKSGSSLGVPQMWIDRPIGKIYR